MFLNTEENNAEGSSEDKLVGLRERLTASNCFIKSMIDLIPPAVYFADSDSKKMSKIKHNEVEAKLKGKANKLTIKAKQKLSRLDPELRQSTSQVLEKINNVSTDDEDEDEEEEAEELPEKKQKKEAKKKKKKNKNKKGTTTSTDAQPTKDDLSLKDKLQKKIEQLKGNRRTGEKFLEKVKNRRKGAKERRKKTIVKQKQKKVNGKVQGEKDAETEKYQDRHEKKIKNKKQPEEEEGKESDGGDEFNFNTFKTDTKRKRGQFSGKNYKEILQTLKKKQKRIDKIGEKNVEKADRIKENGMWKTALDRAEGVKVRDDVNKLKKVIKKKHDLKKRSQKQWAERLRIQEAEQDKKQKKRKDNIKKRRDSKKEKRIDHAKKKGRFIQPF